MQAPLDQLRKLVGTGSGKVPDKLITVSHSIMKRQIGNIGIGTRRNKHETIGMLLKILGYWLGNLRVSVTVKKDSHCRCCSCLQRFQKREKWRTIITLDPDNFYGGIRHVYAEDKPN